MSVQFLSRDAIRAPMKFPPALQRYIDQRLAMLAQSAAAIMRRNAPRDDGDLIAGIRAEGKHVIASAGHSMVTEWGSKRKMPKQKRRKGQPKLTRTEKRAAAKKWKRDNPNVPAQPYFFRSIFEAIDRERT